MTSPRRLDRKQYKTGHCQFGGERGHARCPHLAHEKTQLYCSCSCHKEEKT